jgi:hypothetical protein
MYFFTFGFGEHCQIFGRKYHSKPLLVVHYNVLSIKGQRHTSCCLFFAREDQLFFGHLLLPTPASHVHNIHNVLREDDRITLPGARIPRTTTSLRSLLSKVLKYFSKLSRQQTFQKRSKEAFVTKL